jgi:hypothetical protein
MHEVVQEGKVPHTQVREAVQAGEGSVEEGLLTEQIG